MTDIELMPLPVRNYVDGDGLWETATGPYSAEETQAYARANMEPLLAEIETLRNQRDFLVAEYERAVDCGEQGYTHAAMHLFNAIANAQADENTKTIMAPRAERDSFQRAGIVAQARAERLAEVLRGMMDKWDRIGDEHGVRQFTGNDHKLFANELRALLSDHEQEAGMADLIERINARLALMAAPPEWADKPVYVDAEPVRTLLREAADALEAAREDAGRWNELCRQIDAGEFHPSILDDAMNMGAGALEMHVDDTIDAAREDRNG